jgi:hypothetical protein
LGNRSSIASSEQGLFSSRSLSSFFRWIFNHLESHAL